MLQEFVDFLSKYNVVGLAIWLIIWAQVTALAASLIDDLVTPLILSPVFTKLKVERLEDLCRHGILWGKVISNLIKFILVAVLVFVVVRSFDMPAK